MSIKPKREGPKSPPPAVYAAGKKKERASKAIALVKLLIADSSDEMLKDALKILVAYREKLNIL